MKRVIFAILQLFLFFGCNTTSKVFRSAEELDPLPNGDTKWTKSIDNSRKSLIKPPEKISCLSDFMLNKAEKEFGKELVPGRVLTWSTDLGIASGALELYVEKGIANVLEPRLIYLLRMQVSYYVSSPFAIDVNSWQYKDYKITINELKGLQGKKNLTEIDSFSQRELTALLYAQSLSKTPVSLNGQLLEDMRHFFSQEEILSVVTLIAKVNYWARFIEGMRIKPAGYSDDPILDLENYNTFED